MLDRYNHLWEAQQDDSSGDWVLNPEPLAKLGPGRPLGYHFDHDGNLIVCDSLKVRCDESEVLFAAGHWGFQMLLCVKADCMRKLLVLLNGPAAAADAATVAAAAGLLLLL
jgi:hypothetical protein